MQLHLQAKENAQAQQFALTSREAELLHQREQDRLRLQYTENEKRLMIEEKKLETQLQLEYTRGKYDLDRSAQNHQDEIEAKRHNRGMQLLKEQKAYSKAQLEWNREESRRLDRQKSVLKLEAASNRDFFLMVVMIRTELSSISYFAASRHMASADGLSSPKVGPLDNTM